jgi:hypothetical protein
MTWFLRLVIVAWLLNAYDAAITVYATDQLALVELNPLMRWCLSVSVILFLVVKLGVMTWVCRTLHKRRDERPRLIRGVLAFIIGIFLALCVWNTFVVSVASSLV